MIGALRAAWRSLISHAPDEMTPFAMMTARDLLCRARKAEQEALVLRRLLRGLGYTDQGLNRKVEEHLERLKREARAM